MSQEKKAPSIIILTALLLVSLFPLLNLAGGGGGGGGCGTAGVRQCGSTVVTINAGALIGSATAPISGFTTIPKLTLTPRTSAISNFIQNIPSVTLPFLAVESGGQTMNAIPAGITEIFGDTNHELIVDSRFQNTNLATTVVDCTGNASIGTETIRPQWFDISISTWESVSNTVTAGDVPLGCPAAPVFSPVMGAFTPLNATLSAKPSGTNIQFRIVIFGGDGLTSSFTFTEIHMMFYLSNNLQNLVSVSGTVPLITLISITVRPNYPPTTSQTVTVDWQVDI